MIYLSSETDRSGLKGTNLEMVVGTGKFFLSFFWVLIRGTGKFTNDGVNAFAWNSREGERERELLPRKNRYSNYYDEESLWGEKKKKKKEGENNKKDILKEFFVFIP